MRDVCQVVGDFHEGGVSERPARAAVTLVHDGELGCKAQAVLVRVAPVEVGLWLARSELVAVAHTALSAAVALL